MLCPNCQKDEVQVIDSRDDGKIIWRRRKCLKCDFRFTTYERIEVPKLTVVKRDQRREPFSKEKVINGIQKACQKRPVSMEQIIEAADNVEKQLFELKEPEISSKLIGEIVMKELEKIDDVAYIRFASIYRAFKSAESFDKEVHKILNK
ncbi:MAG: transcriptional regulator NrdR [Candidatus Berkelbacteria bacterium]|nr:transcriptional regulator NrdR [Candidatus Berkelbacteria bacterium]